MSWLNNITDLAGKAESLLNNIDQSAANAISKASNSYKEDSEVVDKKSDASSSVAFHEQTQSIEKDNGNMSGKPSHLKTQTPRRQVSKINNQQTDEALFNFLNSDQKVTKLKTSSAISRPDRLLEVKHKLKKNRASIGSGISKTNKEFSSSELSRNTSYDSLISKKSSRKISDNGSLASDHHESNSEPGNSLTIFINESFCRHCKFVYII